MHAGATKSFHVTVHNPSTGVVTLNNPLACAILENEVCADHTQVIAPGKSASATFTLSAVGVAPGSYIVKIARVHPVTITVTSAGP